MQITLTLDLTAENLDKLKVFCQETGAAPAQAEKKAPATKAVAKTAKAEPKQEAKEEPATEAPKEEAPAAEETKEENPLTLTDVRAVALKLSKAGKSDVLKDIFKKFGATKLSEVPADKYGELMQELTNA
jgi:hypothetical protein